jgi:hydrogenase nickel incorporation protein HypA/HybF
MHEMPVTQHLLDMALEHAGGRRVTDIHLAVGALSAIVPSSVAIFFRYLAEDSPAEGAELHFTTIPLEMTCRMCGHVLDLSRWSDLRPQAVMGKAYTHGCERCGGSDLEVTDGVRFEMISIEVTEPERDGAG